MSRHDWKAIAEEIRDIPDAIERERVAINLADYFTRWYKAFDRAKWFAGCAVLRTSQ